MGEIMEKQVYVQPWDVNTRLDRLGLRANIFQKAAQDGHLGLVSCTENDPPFFRGLTVWGYTIRSLREQLVPLGWKRDNAGNYARTFSDESRINIIVASADAGTGRSNLIPRTKSPKGSYTQQAVQSNAIQGVLEGFLPDLNQEGGLPSTSLGYPTWIFLIYITEGTIRAELSFPTVIESGNIQSWRERIILPEIDIDPSPLEKEPEDSGPDFTIEIQRKA